MSGDHNIIYIYIYIYIFTSRVGSHRGCRWRVLWVPPPMGLKIYQFEVLDAGLMSGKYNYCFGRGELCKYHKVGGVVEKLLKFTRGPPTSCEETIRPRGKMRFLTLKTPPPLITVLIRNRQLNPLIRGFKTRS